MTDVLARRYRVLLRAYPSAYRAERGDEILGTLLDAASPGQRWPGRREALSIAARGLGARLDLTRRRSSAEVWTDGLHIGVLVLVAEAFTAYLAELLVAGRATDVPPAVVAGLVLAAAAVVAVLRGRCVAGLVLAAAALAVPPPYRLLSWQLLLAVGGLAVLVARDRSRRRVRSPGWLLVVPLLLWISFGGEGYFTPPDGVLAVAAVAVAATAGLLVDPRLPIVAACITFAAALELNVETSSDGMLFGAHPVLLVLAGVAVLVLVAGHLRSRRLARL